MKLFFKSLMYYFFGSSVSGGTRVMREFHQNDFYGYWGDSCDCPLARVMKRENPKTFVRVNRDLILILSDETNGTYKRTPKIGRVWLNDQVINGGRKFLLADYNLIKEAYQKNLVKSVKFELVEN